MLTPAVVISSYTMGLGVIRGLGSMGVPVVVVRYDPHDMGHVSRHVREVIDAPHPERSEERFVDLLLQHGRRLEGSLLVPASDAALAAVSRNKEALSDRYVVAATEWSITRRFIEKKHTYALAEEVGVPAPRTSVPRSLDDVERYGGSATFPCLVKPSQGHLYKARFGAKMERVDDLDALVAAYRRADEAGLEVMVQEIIPGPDGDGANYNSYTWDGSPVVEFTARKVRGSPPVFGSPRVARSEIVPEVLEPGRRILHAMGFYGFSCTEFKRDARDGVWKLMEVNGRHNLSSLLAVRCGVNFPWIQYRHLVDGDLPRVRGQRTGLYWIDLVRDLGCDVAYAGREPYRLRDYLRPYLRPHVFAIADLRDPMPFAVRLADVGKTAISSARARIRRSTPERGEDRGGDRSSAPTGQGTPGRPSILPGLQPAARGADEPGPSTRDPRDER
jgi:predicted ATP-grasp superfamily ATP-dependent carboligase